MVGAREPGSQTRGFIKLVLMSEDCLILNMRIPGWGCYIKWMETRLEFTEKAFPIKFSDKFLKYLHPPSQGKENDLSSEGNIQEASLFLKQENLVLYQEDLFFS